MSRTPALRIEPLETRDVPTVFGNPWPNAGSLTLSFAPDGTTVSGYSQVLLGQAQASTLFAEMAAAGTTAQWQTELLRAVQAWAATTNINVGLVPDAGARFGPASALPGAGSSGQIRVGAVATNSAVIAVNQPYNPIGGAWAGDLLFNTNRDFSVGAQTGRYDLYTVALHEAGNILGLADRDADSTSALNGRYAGVRTGPNAADVATLQPLYGGVRTPDTWENNETLASAKRISTIVSPTDATKKMATAVGADLTTATDVDHFIFKTDTGTTSATVRLETVGKSLLAGKVSVFNKAGALLGTATSTGPQAMQDVVLTVNGLSPGTDYWVRVEKAAGTAFAVGKYDLKVGFNHDPVAQPGPPAAVSYITDGGNNDTLSSAKPMSGGGGTGNRLNFEYGRIESGTDVDYYRVSAPSATPKPLTVTIDPAVPASLYTKVTVIDSTLAVVPAEVLAGGVDGRVVVQVPNPVASKTYFLKVESVPRVGPSATGDYKITADFTQNLVTTAAVASGTLTGAAPTGYSRLAVPEAKMFQFALSATGPVASGVRMIVYDAANQIVATLTADAGGTSTASVLLNAGTYTLKFEAAARTGGTLTSLAFALRAVVLSDPIDVYDPTEPPPAAPDFDTGPYTGPVLDDPWADPWSDPVG